MLPRSSDVPCRPVRFEVLADAEPGLFPRVLAPFARRDLIPDKLRARRDGAFLRVEIGMEAMPPEVLHLVEGNLRQIVGVHRVAVTLCPARRPTRATPAGAVDGPPSLGNPARANYVRPPRQDAAAVA